MSDRMASALVGLLVGVVVGAVVMLFLAPMSGKELQVRVRKEAEADWQKGRAEYYKSMNEVQKAFDGLKGQIASLTGRA
ncbi:MAG: YtxH domain-containing protein [Coriobacteriia bacterium]|nr:YtxH domain-containing protein [Coriobacteriia bacterium]